MAFHATGRAELRNTLVERFNRDELELLCRDIQEDLAANGIHLPLTLDIIGGEAHEIRCLNLIEYLDRRGYRTYLERRVASIRPVGDHQVKRIVEDSLRKGVSMSGPIDVFFSYSHKDESLRDELAAHLKLLERTGVIRGWHDRRIGAGEDWRAAIDYNLEKAHVILLLVSADFLASDYCYDVEMKRAIARHDAGEAAVFPVILRDCNWTRAPFSKLQALPKDAKPVTSWTNRDEAWTNVASGIEEAVTRLGKR
jgi:hypothetical protein